MKPSKINPNYNQHLEKRLNVLSKIRNFQEDFKQIAEQIRFLTERLLMNYSTGMVFLSQHLSSNDYLKCENVLNQIRVHATTMNHILDKAIYFNSENEINLDITSEIKIFEERKGRMAEYAQRFELLGQAFLDVNEIPIWKANFCVFEEKFAKVLESYSQSLRMIGEIFDKYSPKEIKILSKIIAENQDNENNNEEFEIEYLKAISQFKREFSPENLWDKFLEVLAGEVDPFPQEKVKMSRWMDNEQKNK